MTFNSSPFMLFFPVFVLLYYILPVRARRYFLLLGSYFFYAFYSPVLLLYLLSFTVLNYLAALALSRFEPGSRKRKRAMTAGVILDVAVLAFYKYFNFFSVNLHGIFSRKGDAFTLHLLVPLGISFITFTFISYLVDVYRGTIPAEKNILRFAIYISFFPKVVQGPIEAAGDFLPQLDRGRRFDVLLFREGFIMVLYGEFMKMVVADTLGVAVDFIYLNPDVCLGATLLFGTFLFALQIYCDFAGYSLIAIGAAKILGFRLKQNFRQPYLSSSVGEFWRRWHMSLNNWLTKYVYIPLGGSRCSEARTTANTLITFGLSGLWHGADWGYVIWGLLNGLYVSIERFAGKHLHPQRKGKEEKNPTEKNNKNNKNIKNNKGKQEKGPVSRFFGRILTFVLVSFSWIFFRAQSLEKASLVVYRITHRFLFREFASFVAGKLAMGPGSLLYNLDVVYGWRKLILGLLVVLVVDLLAEKHDIPSILARSKRSVRWTVEIILLITVIVFGVYGFEYNASAFIYSAF